MIATDDVVAITQNIFSTMLDMESYPVPTDTVPEHDSGIVGCIQIVGEYSGTILLKTPTSLATVASSRMLLLHLDDVEDADRQDTIAELTNMIGGNIKSVFPGPSHLSLPTVTNGTDFRLRLYGSSIISETAFQCDEHVFSVVVLIKNYQE